jgi:hypothetical protein
MHGPVKRFHLEQHADYGIVEEEVFIKEIIEEDYEEEDL